MPITVELYGIPRAHAGVPCIVSAGKTLGDIFQDLTHRFPVLGETCFQGRMLKPGYTASLGGDRFVADPATVLKDGDVVLLLSLDAGG